ncbi:MAG: carbamoyltransferase family protein, partial [Planctomycetota bacterium]
MKVLGIGGQGYRDSAAALLVDGRLVAAASEGRFSRVKHEGGFPRRAIEACLGEAGLSLKDVDRIAVANNSWLLLRDRLSEWYGEGFLESRKFRTYHIFHDEMHRALRYLLEVEDLRREYGERFRVVVHHLAHMAETFYLSPFEEAAILVVDGRGEVSTSSLGAGKADGIEVFALEQMPNSIGLLCAAVADFLGFRDEDDEFRIMSISSLGESRYLDKFRTILKPAPGGSYLLDPDYFDTFEGRAFLSDRFQDELGPGRGPGGPVEEHHADIAASLQGAVEDVCLHMARHLAENTGLENLCLAGGVAQNWVLGGRLRREGAFARVHTGFAPGDEGTAIGAAIHVHMTEVEGASRPEPVESDLGPRITTEEIETELRRVGIAAERPRDPVEDAAARISEGRLVGWFEGRMEFGPRALGHRSILLDAANARAKERLVSSVKPRARYHPFGIAVPEGALSRYFDDVRPDAQMASHRVVKQEERDGLAPVLHTDGTARVQTVSASHSGSLLQLLEAVE